MAAAVVVAVAAVAAVVAVATADRQVAVDIVVDPFFSTTEFIMSLNELIKIA
jgi:hypothetical protein